MVQYYSVLGQKVGSHYLAMGVLTALFGGSYLGFSGPKKVAAQTPPINASSPEESDFIQKFLKEADKSEKEAKH